MLTPKAVSCEGIEQDSTLSMNEHIDGTRNRNHNSRNNDRMKAARGVFIENEQDENPSAEKGHEKSFQQLPHSQWTFWPDLSNNQMSRNNKRRKTQYTSCNKKKKKKGGVNRLLVSFLPVWKVKNHLIYVPQMSEWGFRGINIWKYYHCIHKHTHTGPFSWTGPCHYSRQEGSQSFSWRVPTLEWVTAVNRPPHPPSIQLCKQIKQHKWPYWRASR